MSLDRRWLRAVSLSVLGHVLVLATTGVVAARQQIGAAADGRHGAMRPAADLSGDTFEIDEILVDKPGPNDLQSESGGPLPDERASAPEPTETRELDRAAAHREPRGESKRVDEGSPELQPSAWSSARWSSR